MKQIININEEDYKGICHLKNEQLRMLPVEVAETLIQIKNGTLIPDNATNGDVIKAMFGVEEVDMSNTYCVHFPEEEEDYGHYFFKEWWNAPYQKGGKE